MLLDRVTYLFSFQKMGAFDKLGDGMKVFAAVTMLTSAAKAQETPKNIVFPSATSTAEKTNEVMLPHPDGEIVVDVTRVALETQMEILTELGACLQDGHDFADADENGNLDDVEVHDFRDEGEWCAEDAELALREADADARITEASAQIAASKERQAVHAETIKTADVRIADADVRLATSKALRADAQAKINAITKGLMEGVRILEGLATSN